jgi:peptide/nickel transport system permease protein
MTRSFAARRLGGLAGTIVVAVVLTFVIVPLIPGDPAVSAAGPDATVEQIEQVRAELGLDRPLAERFIDYVGGLVQGDMGHSFSLNAPVAEVVFGRLPFTAGLAFASLVVVLLVAVPVGMTVGVLTRGGRRRFIDSAFGYTTAVVAAIPPYVMATLLVLVFAVSLQVLPPAYSRSRVGISLLLPLMALSIPSICFIARVVRRETAVVLEQDYLRTARGWRLGALRTYGRYALPNLLTSTLTLSGIILIGMLGGAITVETVFSWPGLGLGIVNAVTAKDYPLIQGIVLVLAVLSALLTLAVDVVLGMVDPRVRHG